MASLKRRLLARSNRWGVWAYQRSNGRLAGNSRKNPVLVLTTPGRRSGRPVSTCVRYLPYDGGYLVWGTASGAPRDPDWFQNLRAAGAAQVRAGSERFHATARELVGEERQRVWRDVVLAEAPAVARYERKAGRVIPVAFLSRG